MFEKDYAEEYRKKSELVQKMFDCFPYEKKLEAIDDYDMEPPKALIPGGKEAFDRLLINCNKLAAQWGGKSTGEFDFERWKSKITVILPFIEFSSDEDRALLRDISDSAFTICFQPTGEGSVKMTVHVSCFETP